MKSRQREIVGHTQRIQKVLETCNIKLASVATDILGATGRAILRAIIKGDKDPAKLADLAKGALRAKRGLLVEALRGKVRDHHRFLLEQHLGTRRQGSMRSMRASLLTRQCAGRGAPDASVTA